MSSPECIVVKRVNGAPAEYRFGVFQTNKTHGAREVGALIRTSYVVYEAGYRVATYKNWWGEEVRHFDARMEPGAYFAWIGEATRGRETYGASQRWRYCKTECEREAEIAKYLKAAKARAVKRFAAK